jgi:hypothetical protein
MTNYAESITCPVTRFLGKNAPAWHSSVRGHIQRYAARGISLEGLPHRRTRTLEDHDTAPAQASTYEMADVPPARSACVTAGRGGLGGYVWLH